MYFSRERYIVPFVFFEEASLRKKVLIVFGTRPEVEAVTCATAQHRHLLDQVLGFFSLKPDIDLNLMKPNQDLTDITVACLSALREVFRSVKPDIVLVQGDTTTTMASALAAFYAKLPVGHVEAGLRTGDKYSPYPEEVNRKLVSPLADYHFAPTTQSQSNLQKEGVPAHQIFLTGNTSIDALLWASERNQSHPELGKLFAGKKLVLLTAHRRENFGEPLRQIFTAVRDFAARHPEVQFVYPVHPNPNVKGAVDSLLKGVSNISLIDPVGYSELVFLLKHSQFILSDSGGIQEEAPTLGKPVLVLRETTERPEAVTAGCAKLVGSDQEALTSHMNQLLDRQSTLYQSMSRAGNPFGDGTAGKKIAAILESQL
jgi:UDP-N-acetylglucosamine 2-epimerase (non-hydrolysing)